MTTYVAPGVVNPYRSGVSGGAIPGDAATGHLIRLVDEYVDYLEPWDTPLDTKIFGQKKKSVNQLKIENGIKRQRPLKTILNNAYTSGGATVDLGTTNVALVGRGFVLKIDDEIFWTTGEPDTSAGTIAVAGAQAGTSAANHDDESVVEIIGTATTLNSPNYYNSPVMYGDFVYNHPQRFQGQITQDDMAIVTPDWEYDGNDKLLEMIGLEAKYQKILRHKALIHGLRQEGTLASGAARPSLMGGILEFLTTNVNTITNTAPLSVFDIEEVSSDVWQTYRKMARTMVGSMTTKRALNRLLNPYREGTLTDDTLNLKLDVIKLETGDFTFMVDPYMPDGELWGLDFSGFTPLVYKDHDWQVRDTKDPTTMGDSRAVVGAFSMLMPEEPLMWRITGFSTNLNAYPTGQF